MTPSGARILRKMLIIHEDYRQYLYFDKVNCPTIGYGRNLHDRGISQDEAGVLLDDDIVYFSGKLNQHFPWFRKLSDNRQIALINMCYNIGVYGFLKFTDMILALESSDYERAANAMLDSKWAEQVGQRARELADIIKNDEIPYNLIQRITGYESGREKDETDRNAKK